MLSGLRFNREHPAMILGPGGCEDASILTFPAGKALIQTLDFFTPIVNDAYDFGQIAAANALSDVYAMGGEPYAAMNIVCFPAKKMDKKILRDILQGGVDKIEESGALMAGGHSVEDDEIKYGLSVSGLVDPNGYASNSALEPGDVMILTKPLGTGVLATALKAEFGNVPDMEADLVRWAGRLNVNGGLAIQKFALKAATDITGFGLGGHLLEMARASNVLVEIDASRVPVLESARELAGMGMIPAGSYANKHFCEHLVLIDPQTDCLTADLIFDAQTSGGLVLGVPEDLESRVRDFLLQSGDMAETIGRVLHRIDDKAVSIRP